MCVFVCVGRSTSDKQVVEQRDPYHLGPYSRSRLKQHLCGSSLPPVSQFSDMHHHALAAGAAPSPAPGGGAVASAPAPTLAALAPLTAVSGAAAVVPVVAAAVATTAVEVPVATPAVAAAGTVGAAVGEGLDAFVQLGVLIVEGRVAGAKAGQGTRGPRGYAEGPHCGAPPGGAGAATPQARAHQCDTNNFLCSRARRLRAHLRLLWQTRLPLCVEVLAAPECACAAARAHAVDVGAPPPPAAAAADLLLERWHVSVAPLAPIGQPPRDGASPLQVAPGGEMSVRSLFCAVRSQLHFSQLAAWLSASGGARPRHVCYRLALPALSDAPGAFAASRFSRPPIEHAFPPAPLLPGGHALQVSVQMLPRMEALPNLLCPLHPNGETPELTSTIAGKPDAAAGNSMSSNVGAIKRTSVSSLSTCASDPHLGDSLLDPPPSLQLLRSRTPRLSSPPPAILPRSSGLHLTTRVVRTSARWRDGSPPSPPSTTLPQRRRGRQGMARRRDTSSGGLSSLKNLKGTVPGDLLDDRMQNPCTRPGKHHCRCAYEDDTADCGSSPIVNTARSSATPSFSSNSEKKSTGACANSETSTVTHLSKTSTCQSNGSSSRKLSLELSQSEVEEVLAVLRDRNTNTRPSNICSKSSSVPSSACRDCDSDSPHHKHQLLPSIPTPQESSAEVYHCKPSTSTSKSAHKADLLLDAILRTRCPARKLSPDLKGCDPDERVTKDRTKVLCDENNINNDGDKFLETPRKTSSSIPLLHRRLGHLRGSCSPPPPLKVLQISEPVLYGKSTKNSEIVHTPPTSVGQTVPVPSAQETALFRRSLRSAACMVFHCRTGLPLTSSPAPLRRRHDSARFDFDSSLNSVSAIRSALFEGSGSPKNGGLHRTSGTMSPSEDSEASTGSPGSPGFSPQAFYAPLKIVPGPMPWPPRCHLSHCSSLLGSFEESVLNGRLEPVSTVQGFTADLGASGIFCPRHLLLPVTVFFYTLGDNDKVSTPYLGHINLGKKGYTVPRAGTIQVTLLNPLGTVVKMFVVQYDLTDMPPQATTFLRQRTLYLPAGCNEKDITEAKMHSQALQKHLRYLIHLRFSTSRSGRISLHTDIRMIIFRKSDLDTATAHGGELAYELRSFTHGPTNPKFSPRK